MKKIKFYIVILTTTFFSFPSFSQSIINKTWVVKEQAFEKNGNVVIAYTKDSTNNIVNLSNISFTFHLNNTYDAVGAFGQTFTGNYSLANNQLIMDGEVNDFLMLNSDSFQLSKTVEMLSTDTSMVTTLSKMTFIESSILPIELINFKAKVIENLVVLSWKTESETNIDYFEIQHSIDGKEFLPIGKVEGNGTTKVVKLYDFIHEQPVSGINYYRLKQVDFDGEFTFSNIVNVRFDSEEKISINPNPAKDFIYFQFSDSLPTEISILNIDGSELKKTDSINEKIDVSFLESGVYLLLFQFENGNSTIQKIH